MMSQTLDNKRNIAPICLDFCLIFCGCMVVGARMTHLMNDPLTDDFA